MRRKTFSIGNVVIASLLLMFALFCVYPVIYVILASLSDPIRLAQHTGALFVPTGFTLKGYQVILQYSSIWTGYMNTLIICVGGTSINMIMTIMAAYVLMHKELYLHRFFNIIAIITMYFGGGMIPTYMVVKSLGLVDSRLALIFPVAISTWNAIILRSAMSEVPSALLDSALIDGASDTVILTRIVLPLIKPTLAVLTLYYMMGHWNSWFSAMIYLQDRKKYPLQLILREILISGDMTANSGMFDMTSMDLYKQLTKYCSTVVAVVPVLLIYPFLQKFFVKGVMIGAVKG